MNDFCLKPPLMDNTLPHLFYTNFKTNTHNKIVYDKTPSKTFKFLAKDIHYETCPSHFKLSMLPSHISGLYHELLLKKNMLVKLCVGNYVTLNGLVNDVDGTFQDYMKKIQNH
jgi:hypothetical protein